MITKEEIQQNCVWDDCDTATLHIYSNYFGKEIEVIFRSNSKRKIITDKMVACCNDFLALSEEGAIKLKELLYSHCRLCFNTIQYGHIVPKGIETYLEANQRGFHIFNPDTAFDKSNIESVYIDRDHDHYKNRYVEILFYPDWEDEHGCTIILKNGKPIEFEDSMPYIGKYEYL
ncbi:DUF6985 domain-containing protein [Aquimarina algicola]|uniref:DUF6985 domain-containing protein n=1 Tax=Aquimarina algicola TaxID=2589995 RepID=A0A504JFM0_9FLAO|nr:hypothetical protein [Aquimarina algicola]TPN85310.1 hypothetical protein FHK87_14920 [Aquimarina algicola]